MRVWIESGNPHTSFLAFGIRSLILFRLGNWMIPSFRCFIQSIHLPLAELGECTISLMGSTLSLDRFQCMHDPVFYRSLGTTYSMVMVGAVFGYALIDLIWRVVS